MVRVNTKKLFETQIAGWKYGLTLQILPEDFMFFFVLFCCQLSFWRCGFISFGCLCHVLWSSLNFAYVLIVIVCVRQSLCSSLDRNRWIDGLPPWLNKITPRNKRMQPTQWMHFRLQQSLRANRKLPLMACHGSMADSMTRLLRTSATWVCTEMSWPSKAIEPSCCTGFSRKGQEYGAKSESMIYPPWNWHSHKLKVGTWIFHWDRAYVQGPA